MAVDTDQEAPGGRVVLLTALLALVASGTAAFGRVFEDNGTSVRLVLAAAVSLALAAVLERRHIVWALLASAAGLALMVTWLVWPQTTWHSLPTLTTWERLLGALEAVGRTAEAHVAPAPTRAPLLLAALSAVWASTFAVHALASRARSPFLSLLPPASLLAFAGAVMDDGARPVYVLPFLASCLGVLFGDALYRVVQWGPLTVWHGRRGAFALGSATWNRGARRVALASLAVGLFTPWILPGFGSQSVLDVRSGGGGSSVTIDPIVDIRPRLLRQPDVEMFTVRSARPSYWRFLALEEFNGRRWTSADLFAEGGQEVSGPLPPQISLPERATGLGQVFEFKAAQQPWLPAAYLPVRIDVQEEAVRLDAATSTLVLPGSTYRGFTYEVTSLQYTPTPEELDAIATFEGTFDRRLTDLPVDVPSRIGGIARAWVKDAPTPYRRVLAIQDRLRAFTYDENALPGHDVNDLLHFLTESKRGYCEQFAGTMAVMLRALGIPSRVAVGFTYGRFDQDTGVWRVTGKNAHTWVEVLFPGYGWLAFEPTPGRTNPVASRYTTPAFQRGSAGGSVGAPTAPPIPQTQLTPAGAAGCAPGTDPRLCKEFQQLRSAGDPSAEPPSPWPRRILGGALALAGLAFLAVPVVKAARRRLRLVRARSPRQLVLAAYDVFDDQARDLGLGRRLGETLREHRARLEREVSFSNGHLQRLTSVAGRAAYSSLPVPRELAQEALTDARRASTDIRRSRGTLKVLAGWFRVERFASSP
jgi:transglutaminase-like putative cysteine protease